MPLDHCVIREITSRLCHLIVVLSGKYIHMCVTGSWHFQINTNTTVTRDHGVIRKYLSQLCHGIMVLSENSLHVVI